MPLATMLRRARRSISVSDDFTGVNGAALAARPTPVGGIPWQVINGVWTIQTNRASTSTGASSNPVAVLDLGTPDIDEGLDISPTGRDAIYFRVTDGNNWIRAKLREVSSTIFCTYTNYVTNFCADCCNGNQNCPTCGCNVSSGTSCGLCGGPPRIGSCTTSGTCSLACGTQLDYYVDIDKMVAGTLTTVQAVHIGTSVSVTHLRVVTSNTTVTVYRTVGGVEAQVWTGTITDFASVTKHGIGRGGSSGNDGSALDNYSLSG